MRPLLLLALTACAADTEPDPALPDDTTPLEITGDSFPCITEMEPVRRFYVTNLRDDPAATVAVAAAPEGKAWPVGSLVQLVPAEAMVKREAGFSPETDDWEFFFLRTTAEGTEILTRGAADAENAFGGNCADCHRAAKGTWDWICEQDHGCVDLPFTEEGIRGIQERDPRCGG